MLTFDFMEIYNLVSQYSPEKLVFGIDEETGLKSIICIDSTKLGPASGGLRIVSYKSEKDALKDALRLSKAMTYKAAMANLPLGGGKAVIIAEPSQKEPALLHSFGNFLNQLEGQFIAGPDVGVNENDLKTIQQTSKYIVGITKSMMSTVHQQNNTAHMAGLGVYLGMKACVEALWGTSNLKGRTVAIQGFGKVAKRVARLLHWELANVWVTDIKDEEVKEAERLGYHTISADMSHTIYDMQCDIFCPCALGGILNENTINRLKCEIVAGSANNQLESDQCGELLHKKNILYAPDYLINAGGLMLVATEILKNYSYDMALASTENIFDTMNTVIQKSKEMNMSTNKTANLIVEDRLLNKIKL